MVIATRISNEAYEQLALTEPDIKWELVDGILREKPGMTYAHNSLAFRLGVELYLQLDRSIYEVRVDAGRVHRPGATYLIPDVFVFPKELARQFVARDDLLEVYDQPLPLVVEVWSPSTGAYDVQTKLFIYQQRRDLEIWYIHPYERRLTAWRCQQDGSYEKATMRDGVVRPVALPDVPIDLSALFGA